MANFKATFLINAGQYQNIELVIEAPNAFSLVNEMASYTDEFKARLGQFHAELESWVKPVREATIEGREKEAIDLIATAMGATVTSTEPAKAASPAPAVTKSKPWEETEKPKATSSLDSF